MPNFVFLNNKRYPGALGMPGDRGCVACAKLATDLDPDAVYVVDARDRYWCLEHAGDALADIARAVDDRPNIVYRWTFAMKPTTLSTTREIWTAVVTATADDGAPVGWPSQRVIRYETTDGGWAWVPGTADVGDTINVDAIVKDE